jgi:carbon-monoxide dehydrogenase small subunit
MSGFVAPDASLEIELTLNGTAERLAATPRTTLADALRAHGLTGTHLGCEHGVCGACTVLLDGAPVRACLVLALQAAGRSVDTVEGLAPDDDPGPVVEAFVSGNALQCGFCTPGLVVLATWLSRVEPDAGKERVCEVLSSSLCRCTGGGPAVEAALAVLRGDGTSGA